MVLLCLLSYCLLFVFLFVNRTEEGLISAENTVFFQLKISKVCAFLCEPLLNKQAEWEWNVRASCNVLSVSENCRKASEYTSLDIFLYLASSTTSWIFLLGKEHKLSYLKGFPGGMGKPVSCIHSAARRTFKGRSSCKPKKCDYSQEFV